MNHLYISKIIICICILSGCGNKAPALQCDQWHTGEYELVDNERNILIERTASEQVETDRNSGTYTKFHVKWVNNCTYQLYFAEGEERFFEVWKDNFLEVRITGATDVGYAYQARFSTSDKVENYEIRKIE